MQLLDRCFASGTVLATTLLCSVTMALADDPISLRPGFARVLTLDQPILTAIVGDPTVADVTIQGDRKLVVTAKRALGRTNLIVLDRQENEIFNEEIVITREVPGHEAGAVHVQPLVNRNALHNFEAYYCPAGGGLCKRVKDPVSNLTQVESRGAGPQANQPGSLQELPPGGVAPPGTSPTGAPAPATESSPGLQQ